MGVPFRSRGLRGGGGGLVGMMSGGRVGFGAGRSGVGHAGGEDRVPSLDRVCCMIDEEGARVSGEGGGGRVGEVGDDFL